MNDRASGHAAQRAQAAFRVLAVDDDPDMASFLAGMLVQQGMQAEVATDGHASLSLHAMLGGSMPLDRRAVKLKGKAEPVEVVTLRVSPA